MLLLDEPTRNFSPLSGPVIRKLLADFEGAVISISHDRKYMEEVCDTIYESQTEGWRRNEDRQGVFDRYRQVWYSYSQLIHQGSL